MGQVDTLQIASQRAQQVDYVAWAVSLLGWLTITPALQQVKQAPLRSTSTADCDQMLQDGLADEPLLAAPHVVLGLCLHQRGLQQHVWPSALDLVAHFFN